MRLSPTNTATVLGLPIAILLSLSPSSIVDANNLRSYPQGADDYSTTPGSSSPDSVFKKLLSWPFSHDINDVANQSAYPLGQSIPRALFNFNEKQSVFSFTLKSGAAERYQKRQRQLDETEAAEVSVFDTSDALAAAAGAEEAVSETTGEKAHADEEHKDTAHADEELHDTHADDSHGEGHDDEAHDAAHEMVVHVTYEQIYAILVFLMVATGAGIVTAQLGMPALVGEIFTGFLLGPPLADFVPYPEALVLVGEIGLIMLLLEAGVELDVAQLRETGLRALAIGCTGTMLPLLVGMGLGVASGLDSMKSALAVGAAFSPTSLGVASSALKVREIASYVCMIISGHFMSSVRTIELVF